MMRDILYQNVSCGSHGLTAYLMLELYAVQCKKNMQPGRFYMNYFANHWKKNIFFLACKWRE
ncbi:hypothetical protein BSQ98_25665 [Serratia liquefaciens]|nr:hypothetical protein BSQ98_25665 [Serratia liquefaciens]